MDSELLAKMFDFIQEQNYDIHSVTVVRNGYLVADATVYPFSQGSKHRIASCTKSIISALIGIAIEQGYIESVDQPILDFFPERSVANLDAEKEAMTLEHVLTMASGLECRDSYLYRWRGLRHSGVAIVMSVLGLTGVVTLGFVILAPDRSYVTGTAQ